MYVYIIYIDYESSYKVRPFTTLDTTRLKEMGEFALTMSLTLEIADFSTKSCKLSCCIKNIKKIRCKYHRSICKKERYARRESRVERGK